MPKSKLHMFFLLAAMLAFFVSAPASALFERMPGDADVDRPLGWAPMKLENEKQEELYQEFQEASLKGDFEKAIELGNQFIETWPDHETMPVQLALVYVDMAELEHEEENYREALKHVRSALEHDPENAMAHLSLGMGFFGTGQYSLAIQALQKGLSTVGNHPQTAKFWAYLGESANRLNELELAEQSFDYALKHDPKHKSFRWRFKSIERDQKMERRSETVELDHFVLSYSSLLDEKAIDVGKRELQKAYDDLAPIFGAEATEPLTIVLYRVKEYRETVAAPAWSGGLFDGKIRVPIWDERLRVFVRTLRHEIVHGYVRKFMQGTDVPTWINEGLAQYFEPSRLTANEDREFYEDIRNDDLLSLDIVSEPFVFETDLEMIGRLYSMSLALVQYIIEKEDVETVIRMLEGYREGKTNDEVLQEQLSLTEEELMERLKNYFDPRATVELPSQRYR